MKTVAANPFDLTRAADYSDSQIKDYWVDFKGDGGLVSLIEPREKTSKYVLGGKGSGKTHLMRYCSFPVQKLRYNNDLLDALRQEGYIGIFMRATILETGRFQGKGQSEEQWGTLFNYYFEIRLCEQLLGTLVELASACPNHVQQFDLAARDAATLFDIRLPDSIESIEDLRSTLAVLRKRIDFAVNNTAFTRKLEVEIAASPGALLFGIPKLLAKHVQELEPVQFLFLLDEVENLSNEQQEFLNTLIRHRNDPCSFRIGARLYGVKTHKTYGAQEENKEGSEYKREFLDQIMRQHNDADGYAMFARRLCAKRLTEAGLLDDSLTDSELAAKLGGLFEGLPSESFYRTVTMELVKESVGIDRPYFKRLHDELLASKNSGTGHVESEQQATRIVQSLRCDEFPLVEKLNIFMFYQDWFKQKDLVEAAQKIGEEGHRFARRDGDCERHRRVHGHFSLDLLAQLFRDYKQSTTLMYSGLDSFIKLSGGVPRNLLTILKNVYKWAAFNGERPFQGAIIKKETQREALLESAVFFYEEDARPGADVPLTQLAIDRLAEYLRELRFSSKPVESSPLAFSVNTFNLTDEANRCLRSGENWSYLFRIPRGRPNANSKHLDDKFQLNPMLSPKWDLPISRRGDVRLSSELANAIFGGASDEVFRALLAEATAGLKAPKFATRKHAPRKTSIGLFDGAENAG